MHSAGQDRHVLLVVHEQRSRYAVADMLLDAGFRLTVASSFDVADTLLDGAPRFDLLVTAQALPGIGGKALAGMARRACPGLPILLLEQGGDEGPGVLGAAVQLMERWPAHAGTAG